MATYKGNIAEVAAENRRKSEEVLQILKDNPGMTVGQACDQANVLAHVFHYWKKRLQLEKEGFTPKRGRKSYTKKQATKFPATNGFSTDLDEADIRDLVEKRKEELRQRVNEQALAELRQEGN